MEREELAAALFDIAHLTGQFTLRSGHVAQEYFDKYRFEGDPALLAGVARLLAPLIPPGTEVLAGLELGGVPVVTALSLRSGLPAAFVRKAAKPYGTRQLAEGAEIEGRVVLVVEDVVTSGGQVQASTRQLRELGATVNEVLCVIERAGDGRAALAADGLQLSALFTAEELRMASDQRR